MKKLPQFKTLDELVEFWETHDFTDYVDEMEEVSSDSLQPDRTVLYVRIESDRLAKLEQAASQQGLTADRLAQLWIEEKLAHVID